ncbi:hypothetical protein N8I74_11110 [Chitiniphilus purpureus]|uniref:DUF1983 domain-containing protein n=1 Tax=Chitiniphilus purpureus TaxID=2981137 RepID=A0ABY6DK96_9NEIS|nr:hypothetical protein [Chitiniphilus sp. CD1]UXY13871.1 hypothetical protein N8I74_11110 [Chitiniphilus sp. CD1]
MPALAIGAGLASIAGQTVLATALTIAGVGHGLYQAQRQRRKARRAAEQARREQNLKVVQGGNTIYLPLAYGEVRMGGALVFQDVSDDKQHLHLVIAHCEGPVAGYTPMLYLDGVAYTDERFGSRRTEMVQDGTVPVQRPGGIVTEEPRWVAREVIDSAVHWEFFRGTDDQVACQTLINALPAKWTPNHRLRGVCYSYVRLKWDPDKWRAVPPVTVQFQAKTAWDPRAGQMVYTGNPAVMLRDYLLSPRYGRGLAPSDLDEASFIAAANYCDQLLELSPAQWEPRYALTGVLDTGKPCLDNVAELLEHMRGNLLYVDGRYVLQVDQPDAPVMHFSPDNLVGPWSTKFPDRRNRYNRIQARYTSPQANWEETALIVDRADYRTLDGGVLLEATEEYTLAGDERRARYLAERALRASRIGMVVDFVALPVAHAVVPGDVISLTHPSADYVNARFRVSSLAPRANGDVAITAYAYDDGLYAEDPLAAPVVPPRTSLPDPFSPLPPPAQLVLTSDLSTAGQDTLGQLTSRIRASWQPVPGLVAHYRVQWRRSYEPEWQTMTTQDASAMLAAVYAEPFVVRVAAVSSLGRTGEWAVAYINGGGLEQQLAVVTGVQAEVGTMDFTWRWDAHPVAGSYDIEIYAGAVRRRRDRVSGPQYVYGYALNVTDGLVRQLTIRIRARSPDGRESPWVEDTAINDPPGLPGVLLQASVFALTLQLTPPSASDLAGYMVWASRTSGFAVGSNTLVYTGPDTQLAIAWVDGAAIASGQMYYVRVAAFDAFGTADLIVSGEIPVQTTALTEVLNQLHGLGPEALTPALLDQVNQVPVIGQGLQDAKQSSDEAALAALALLARTSDALDALRREKMISDATIDIDPDTGQITLKAVVPVIDDVSARVRTLEIGMDAASGTISLINTDIQQQGGRLSAAESLIEQLANQLSLKVTAAYVDGRLAETTQGVESAHETLAGLSAAQLSSVLNQSRARDLVRANKVSLAVAQQTLTAQADALRAEAGLRLQLAAQLGETEAAIAEEQLARATAIEALTSNISAMLVRVGQAEAGLASESTARANGDSALSQQLAALTSRVGTSEARIVSEETARASGDSANAVAINQVSTTVAGHTASITQQAQSIDGLRAQYVLQVNAAGKVAGVKLAAGASGTALDVLADVFRVSRPDGSGAKAAFTVGSLNGQPAVGISGDMYLDGVLSARGLSALSANVGVVTAGVIRSNDNVTSRWDLNSGYAEFNNIRVRGDVQANSLNGVPVETWHIQGQAVSVADYSQGGFGQVPGGGSTVAVQRAIWMPSSSSGIVVLASLAMQGLGDATITISVRHNGVDVASQSVSVSDAFYFSYAIGAVITPWAGTNNVQIVLTNPTVGPGSWIAVNHQPTSMTLLGAKR